MCGFYFLYSINVMYCIHWFSNVEPPLHYWDKSYLIMRCNPFHMLWNSDWKYFTEEFHMCIQKGYRSINSFIVMSSSISDSRCQEWVRKCSLLFFVMEEFVKDCCKVFKCLIKFTVDPSGRQLFCVEKFLNTDSITSLLVSLFRFSNFFII